MKHAPVVILDRCNIPRIGESYCCELTLGHSGCHQATVDGYTFEYGPSNPPMVPRQSREKRLEMLLSSARDVIVEQRTTIATERARLARAIETLRYVAEVYRSPLCAEAIREILSSNVW